MPHKPGWSPAEALLRRSAGAAAITACVAACIFASGAQATLGLSNLYLLKTFAVVGIVMLIAVTRVRSYHPYARFGLANQVTAARAVLVGLLAGLSAELSSAPAMTFASALCVVTMGLDGVDGWVARRARTASRFGARFDMEVDSLLILVLSVLAWQYGKAGVWVLASGLMRYAFITAAWLMPWMTRPLPPSMRRKTMCVIQEAGLAVILAPWVHPPVSSIVAVVALVFLSYSFLVDIVWLWRQSRSGADDRAFVSAPGTMKTTMGARELEAPAQTL